MGSPANMDCPALPASPFWPCDARVDIDTELDPSRRKSAEKIPRRAVSRKKLVGIGLHKFDKQTPHVVGLVVNYSIYE